MGAVVQLKPLAPVSDQPPATTEAAPNVIDALPAKKRAVARRREAAVVAVLGLMESGLTRSAAVEHLSVQLASGQLSTALTQTLNGLGQGGKRPPSRGRLIDWVGAYQRDGLVALVPKHKGSARAEHGWEARFLELYHRPSKPSVAAVAEKLRAEGHDSATEDRVRRYLKSLPQTHGERSPARVGKHQYRHTRMQYRERDWTVLQVGELYQGDGHCVDAYVEHPLTGGIWRPELTVWMDIRSRYIVGWYISESESGKSTLLSLSHALVAHNHVPAWLHVDNGSGFRAESMSNANTGYYNRFDIGVMNSLPGNAKGKGQVERFFRTYRDKCDKFFDSYCGHDMAAETNRRLAQQIKSGERSLPTLDEYKSAIEAFLDQYHDTPHRGLDGATPNQLWAALTRVPLEMAADAVVRERVERTVSRQSVTLHKRRYSNTQLAYYDGQKLAVEYNIHDDATVWLYGADGRYLCDAQLVDKVAYLPDSRLEEGRQKRLQGQQKRLQRKMHEAEARAAALAAPEDCGDTIKDFIDSNNGEDSIEHNTQPGIDPMDAIPDFDQGERIEIGIDDLL